MHHMRMGASYIQRRKVKAQTKEISVSGKVAILKLITAVMVGGALPSMVMLAEEKRGLAILLVVSQE